MNTVKKVITTFNLMKYILFSILFVGILFSCKKENINGIYAEIEETKQNVIYYEICLCNNKLIFNHLKQKEKKSFISKYKFIYGYEKSFSYNVIGDSLKNTITNYDGSPIKYKKIINLATYKILKNKIILKGMKYTLKKDYNVLEYFDTIYYTRTFYRFKNLDYYVNIY